MWSKNGEEIERGMQYPTENFSLESRMIWDIMKECPDMSEVMKNYFGKDCLKRASFKIKTLEMACILFGVDQKRLLQEIGRTQN
jgi:hypothetical protein